MIKKQLGVTILITMITAQSMATNLKIKIEGLKSNHGGVELTLFNSENLAHYPVHPEHAIKKEYKNIAADQKVEFSFAGLPDGEYAAFAYHDEDGNKKINTNFMHIPTESYGATQGAENKFGPPKFADAKFSLAPNQNKEIEQTILIK